MDLTALFDLVFLENLTETCVLTEPWHCSSVPVSHHQRWACAVPPGRSPGALCSTSASDAESGALRLGLCGFPTRRVQRSNLNIELQDASGGTIFKKERARRAAGATSGGTASGPLGPSY